jgi:hypothetical protein
MCLYGMMTLTIRCQIVMKLLDLQLDLPRLREHALISFFFHSYAYYYKQFSFVQVF